MCVTPIFSSTSTRVWATVCDICVSLKLFRILSRECPIPNGVCPPNFGTNITLKKGVCDVF